MVIGATDEVLDVIRDLVDKGHEVIVLDDNKSRIDRVAAELDVPAYIFSVLDLSALMHAGIHRADMILVAHPLDVVNILVCVYAKHFDIPKVIAAVNSEHVASILEKLGLAHGILIKSRALAKAFTELIYDTKIVELDDEYYIAMHNVKEGSHLEKKSLEDIEGDEIKVLVIISSENNIVKPDKSYILKPGDRILFMVKKDLLESVLFKR